MRMFYGLVHVYPEFDVGHWGDNCGCPGNGAPFGPVLVAYESKEAREIDSRVTVIREGSGRGNSSRGNIRYYRTVEPISRTAAQKRLGIKVVRGAFSLTEYLQRYEPEAMPPASASAS